MRRTAKYDIIQGMTQISFNPIIRQLLVEKLVTKVEDVIKNACGKLYNEKVEPTATNFKSVAKDTSWILKQWTKAKPNIPCKRSYMDWVPPFMNLVTNIEGVNDPDDPLGIDRIYIPYVYGSSEYNDINDAMEMLIPQVKILVKNLKIFIPDGMENLDDWWGNKVTSDGRGMRKVFYGDALKYYLNEISMALPLAYARTHDEDNNNIIYNSPSPKGTGMYDNMYDNKSSKLKKKIPKKGGGRWQSGTGKAMIDEFLDWRDKDRTALPAKEIAKNVWKNPRFKDFVDKIINHSKGPKASEYTFKSSFYPACIRARNCKIAE